MSQAMTSVLLIEDNPGDARLIQELLAEAGATQFRPERVDSLSAGLARLHQGRIDLVLLDLALPDSEGLDTFARVYAQSPQVPIIVLTGLNDETVAVTAVRAGAQDYLVKGQMNSVTLARAIHYAIERKRAEEALRHNRDLLLALSRAAQAVQRAHTPDQIYRVVGEEIKTLGYDLMIFTLSDDREHLDIAHITIAADLLHAAEKLTRLPTQSYRLPIQPESIFGRVVAGERAEFLPSTVDTLAQVLPQVLRPLAGQLMTLLKVERGILAPLHADGATLGALAVTASVMREADVPAVETFAAQVAISLRNARLTQQAQEELAERNRVEEALRENEERYRRLVEQIPDMIGVLVENRLVYLNPSGTRLFGAERPEQMLGKSIADYMHPDDLPLIRERARRAAEEGKPNPLVEFRIIRRDGAVTEMEGVSIPFDYQGKRAVQFMARDITERKHAEESLRESEEIFNQFMQHSPIYVFFKDEAIRAIRLSSNYEKMLGKPVHELLGKTMDDLFPSDLAKSMIADDMRILKEGKLVEIEEELDGRFYSTIKFPICHDGKVRYLAGYTIDITERTRAERALRESEERFRSILDNIEDGYYEVDTAGDFTFFNPALVRMLGRPTNELMGMNNRLYMTPEGRKAVFETFDRVFRTGIPEQAVNWNLVRPDGTLRSVEVSVSLLKAADGSIKGFRGTVRDITERKRAEENLRESEARYRMLAENASDVIWTVGMDMCLTYVSPSVTRLLGFTAEEARARTMQEAYAPASFETAMQVFAEEMALENVGKGDSHLSRMLELEMFHKDGTTVSVETNFRFMRDAAGKPIGILAIVRDITERKWAQEALRQAEAKYRNIFKNAIEGVFQSTPAGKFFTANPALARMLGYDSPEELVAGVNDLNHEFYVQPARREEFMRQLSDYGMISNFESEVYRKDGSTIWISENAQAVRDDVGQVLHYEGTLMDITEHKRAEETLRQRLAELESVHSVSAALRIAQTLDEAMPIVLDQTLTALETDAGTIWLYHPESGELRTTVNRGWFSQLDEPPIKPGEGIAGTVFASGQAHLSAEFISDPLARLPASGKIPQGWGGACVPIRTAAETVGVLFVSVPPPRQITPKQMKLLTSLTEMAGAALHRMRLYEETTRHLRYLQALHEIDRVISTSFDLRMTLSFLIKHVIAQLGVDAADVLLLHPHLQTLDYAAGHGLRTRAIQDSHIRPGESFAGRVALERRALQIQDLATTQGTSPFATLWAGEEFVSYCGVPLIVKGEVKGVLEVFHRAPHSLPKEKGEWLDSLETFAAQAAIAIDNMQLFENLQRSNLEMTFAYDSTIEGWSHALDLRDKETEGHTLRVAEITERLARAVGIGDAELVHIRRGALLHDIGKMGVPDSILLKPGALTEEEWAIMHHHPQLAHDMISSIEYLGPALDIPYCHHEKWDGTGYPRGLKGEQIPLAARLFAVVDVWDALTSNRPYRAAWSREKAVEYIREQSGKHFDPSIVEKCLREIARE